MRCEKNLKYSDWELDDCKTPSKCMDLCCNGNHVYRVDGVNKCINNKMSDICETEDNFV